MAEKNYERMSREELQAERERLRAEYEAFRARGLKLDLSRGKPSNRQLDMMTGMLDCLHTTASYIRFSEEFPPMNRFFSGMPRRSENSFFASGVPFSTP